MNSILRVAISLLAFTCIASAEPAGQPSQKTDPRIRQSTERVLRDALEKNNAAAAWVVVQRCRTGEILASVVISADSNRLPTINETYEPGSVIKPAIIALALQQGMIKADEEINCENGLWEFEGQPLRDLKPLGMIALPEVVRTFSNIGAAKIGLRLGNEKLYEGLRQFGFGEAPGLIPALNTWTPLRCSRIAIGQGMNVTAHQVAGMLNMIANGQNAALNPQVAATMRKMLAQTTEPGGAATNAAVKGYSVAAVTGTTPKVIDGKYSDTSYIASCAGFMPADKPEVIIVVVVDEPKPAYTGGYVAAPIFSNIAQQVMQYLTIKPTL
jgi:cell division protein FtsI (penicillin-binding protein 3)